MRWYSVMPEDDVDEAASDKGIVSSKVGSKVNSPTSRNALIKKCIRLLSNAVNTSPHHSLLHMVFASNFDQYVFVLLLDLRSEVFDAGRSDFFPTMIDCRYYGFG